MTYLNLAPKHIDKMQPRAPWLGGSRRVCRGLRQYRMALSWRHRTGLRGGRWWHRPGFGKVSIRTNIRAMTAKMKSMLEEK